MPRKAHTAGVALLAGALAASLMALALPAGAEEDVWPALKQANFGDRATEAEDGKVVLDAPVTALDASLVPLTVRLPPEVRDNLRSLTLIIDKNPNPVVAKFAFGPAAGTGGERSISTRVRVDTFSHVRAILETEDGKRRGGRERPGTKSDKHPANLPESSKGRLSSRGCAFGIHFSPS